MASAPGRGLGEARVKKRRGRRGGLPARRVEAWLTSMTSYKPMIRSCRSSLRMRISCSTVFFRFSVYSLLRSIVFIATVSPVRTERTSDTTPKAPFPSTCASSISTSPERSRTHFAYSRRRPPSGPSGTRPLGAAARAPGALPATRSAAAARWRGRSRRGCSASGQWRRGRRCATRRGGRPLSELESRRQRGSAEEHSARKQQKSAVCGEKRRSRRTLVRGLDGESPRGSRSRRPARL